MNEEPEVFRLEMLDQKLTEIDEENYAEDLGCNIMTISEFLHDVNWGYLIPDDGAAIIRGGTRDNEYWDWESKIPSDATHIKWCNK